MDSLLKPGSSKAPTIKSREIDSTQSHGARKQRNVESLKDISRKKSYGSRHWHLEMARTDKKPLSSSGSYTPQETSMESGKKV